MICQLYKVATFVYICITSVCVCWCLAIVCPWFFPGTFLVNPNDIQWCLVLSKVTVKEGGINQFGKGSSFDRCLFPRKFTQLNHGGGLSLSRSLKVNLVSYKHAASIVLHLHFSCQSFCSDSLYMSFPIQIKSLLSLPDTSIICVWPDSSLHLMRRFVALLSASQGVHWWLSWNKH